MLQAVAEIKPVTNFHEPINIRTENVERIQTHTDELGVALKTNVIESRERWQDSHDAPPPGIQRSSSFQLPDSPQRGEGEAGAQLSVTAETNRRTR